MGFPIGLHGISLGALLALPLLLPMFSRIVLFDASEVTESPRRVVVDACGLRAQINLPLHLFCSLLL
uniref:Uncharacterized protein MANES_15G141400 n=1 Tax=Rhizophora mucronata TaxID=61149 RepID=A0A2P2Q999_RHIMU